MVLRFYRLENLNYFTFYKNMSNLGSSNYIKNLKTCKTKVQLSTYL